MPYNLRVKRRRNVRVCVYLRKKNMFEMRTRSKISIYTINVLRAVTHPDFKQVSLNTTGTLSRIVTGSGNRINLMLPAFRSPASVGGKR